MIYWIRKEVSFRKMEKLVKLAQYDKAHALLDHLLEQKPTDDDVIMQKSWVFLEEKKFDRVLEYVNSHANTHTHPVYLMLRGEAFYHLGKLDEAEQALLSSAELSPDNLRTEYSLGLIYVAKRDFTNAAKWFENSIKYDANLVQSRLLTMAEHYLHTHK